MDDAELVLKMDEPFALRAMKYFFAGPGKRIDMSMQRRLRNGESWHNITDFLNSHTSLSDRDVYELHEDYREMEQELEDIYYSVANQCKTVAPAAAIATALFYGSMLPVLAQEKEIQVIGTPSSVEARYGTRNGILLKPLVDVKKGKDSAEIGFVLVLPHRIEFKFAGVDADKNAGDAYGAYVSKKIKNATLAAGHEQSGKSRDYAHLYLPFTRFSVGGGAVLHDGKISPTLGLALTDKKLTAGAAYSLNEHFRAYAAYRGMPGIFFAGSRANGITNWTGSVALSDSQIKEKAYTAFPQVHLRRAHSVVPNENFQDPALRNYEMDEHGKLTVNFNGRRGRNDFEEIDMRYNLDGWKMFDSFFVGFGYRREETANVVTYKSREILGARIGPIKIHASRTGNSGEFVVRYVHPIN